jgi:hypothetical protein
LLTFLADAFGEPRGSPHERIAAIDALSRHCRFHCPKRAKPRPSTSPLYSIKTAIGKKRKINPCDRIKISVRHYKKGGKNHE